MKQALAAVLLMALGWLNPALAQDKPKGDAPSAKAAAQTDGVKSMNILDVKPDASDDADYAKQSNAERAKV